MTTQPTAQTIVLMYLEAELASRQEAIAEMMATFAKDPIHGMLWKGEKLQMELEAARNLKDLQAALQAEGADVRAILAERLEHITGQLLRWSPERSTSLISNALDIARHEGQSGFRSVLISIEKAISKF